MLNICGKSSCQHTVKFLRTAVRRSVRALLASPPSRSVSNSANSKEAPSLRHDSYDCVIVGGEPRLSFGLRTS